MMDFFYYYYFIMIDWVVVVVGNNNNIGMPMMVRAYMWSHEQASQKSLQLYMLIGVQQYED